MRDYRVMAPRTLFLSRLIGIYALIISLSMITHKTAIVELVGDFAEAPPLIFIAGMFTLLAGIAMVLMHNLWRGGAPTVIVTLIGWMLLLRGIALVFISPSGAAAIYEMLRFAQFYYAYVAVPLVLGAYLAYEGFRGSPARRPAKAAR